MVVKTILCHGTSNSRNTATSNGNKLVISMLGELLQGREGKDWLLLEGAGTVELRNQGVDTGQARVGSLILAGVFGGKGVEGNVQKAAQFIKDAHEQDPNLKVNLAGHSRGSITCYKIANALFRIDPKIEVNIFAIDPVPGNNGSVNKEMYENINLPGSVRHSFLMLAESEHRLNFRPYVDALYSIGAPHHKFDTIPGTHGGINELGGAESEAATLVLSRALKFLHKHGSPFRRLIGAVLDDKQSLDQYARMMSRIKQYKKGASVNPLKGGTLNLAMSSLNVDKHRIVNVAGPDKKAWGGGVPPEKTLLKSAVAGIKGALTPNNAMNKHHGLNMSDALRRMRPAGPAETPHATRANRFFANQQHEKLFVNAYPLISNEVKGLERSGDIANVQAMEAALQHFSLGSFSAAERDYFQAFCRARFVIMPG